MTSAEDKILCKIGVVDTSRGLLLCAGTDNDSSRSLSVGWFEDSNETKFEAANWCGIVYKTFEDESQSVIIDCL